MFEGEEEEIETELLDRYTFDFTEWVYEQEMTESIFACDADTRIDHPWPNDTRMTALWATQNCKDFDMLLTVMFDDATFEHMVGYVGADLSEKGCLVADYWGKDVYACEYVLHARGDPLGILFKGGFRPVFYTHEWTVTEKWVPAFNWW